MTAKTKKLTPKQQRFVDEYLIDLNATQAAIRTGYSAKTAREIGRENLTKPDIQEAISSARQLLTEKANVDTQAVLKEYLAVAFSNIGEVLDVTGNEPRLRPANQIPESALRAISSMKVKRCVEGAGESAREVEVTEFRFWPKTAALEALARHLDLFGERKPKAALKVDVTTDGKPLECRTGLSAADFAAIAGFVSQAMGDGSGKGIQPDSTGQPLDQGSSPR